MNETQDIVSIQDTIDSLNACDPLWKDHLKLAFADSDDCDDEECPDAVLKMIRELGTKILNKQKQFVDNRNEEEEQAFFGEMTEIMGEGVVKKIKEVNRGILEIYRNIRPLREAGENTIPLIAGVFECVSVNYMPGFMRKQEEYGIDEEDFEALVLQMDRIISVHVSRYYDKRTAQKEFLKITGLEQSYGLVYAELYEKHFERLQHNICLDKLENLSEQMEDLNEQMEELSQRVADMVQQISNMTTK